MIPDQATVDILRTVLFHASLNAQIRLCQVDVGVMDADVTLADLTECDFPGYAPIAASSLPAPALNDSEEAETDSASLVWTAAAGVTTQVAYSVYVTFLDDSGTECLLSFDRFTFPQEVDNPGDNMRTSLSFFSWNGVF